MIKDLIRIIDIEFNKKTIDYSIEDKKEEKCYYINIFNHTIRVISCKFKESDRDFNDKYNLIIDDCGRKLIIIPNELSEIEKVEIIFRKVLSYIRYVKRNLGISDCESEAYIYGYLCGAIISDFINLDSLFKSIVAKKRVNHIIKGGVNFTITNSNSVKVNNRKYFNEPGSNGTTIGTIGEKIQVILIPSKKGSSNETITNIWSHELYHSFKNSLNIGNVRDNYYWKSDLIVELMNISLPVLKNILIHNK